MHRWKKTSKGVFLGKHEGKRRFGRTMCRWGDDIKVDIKEI